MAAVSWSEVAKYFDDAFPLKAGSSAVMSWTSPMQISPQMTSSTQ